MKTKVFYLYALSVLSIGLWPYAGSFISFAEPIWQVTLTLTAWLLISSLLLAAMGLKHSQWVYANLFILGVIPLLPSLLVRILADSLSSIGYGLISLAYPVAVLFTLSLYISSALKIRRDSSLEADRDSQAERLQFEWAMIVPVLGAMTLVGVSPTTLILGGGSGFLNWLITLAVVLGSFFILVWAASSLRHRRWVLAALLVLVLLFLPDTLFLRFFRTQGSELFTTQYALMLLLIYAIALVVLALLIHALLQLLEAWRNRGASQEQHRRAGQAALWVIVLSSLLLARTLYDLYGFMVWDSTTDALGYFWMAIVVPVALLSGILLCVILPDRQKLAGFLYSLLVPALLIGVSARAQTVDFRKLTEERAGRISAAIGKYFIQEDRYPQTLQQLTPRYLLSLSRPVIIYGQDWCYQSGETYYRFGYLDREHWSSPILFGRVVSAQGHSPLKVDVCQPAIDAFRAQNPDWGRVLEEYGKPTPTPDTGE